MKKYIITLSEHFPKHHLREGEDTFFISSFLKTQADMVRVAVMDYLFVPNNFILNNTGSATFGRKIHTIRANYDFWANRIEKIQNGDAYLSVRKWDNSPYKSKQIEIFRLDNSAGIGIQSFRFKDYHTGIVDGVEVDNKNVASNDGLSFADWQSWFKNYDRSKPLAIIHFTKFRYK